VIFQKHNFSILLNHDIGELNVIDALDFFDHLVNFSSMSSIKCLNNEEQSGNHC